MFTNYQFDLANLLIGLLVGIVVTALLRLRALKSLELKLTKIGVDLGVEGFEPEEPSGGVRTGDISGTVGDIVGRDKHVSNFMNKLQRSLSGVVAAHRGIRRRRTERLRWEADDPRVVSELKGINQSYRDGWTDEWIDRCLAEPSCRRAIREVIERSENEGWEPVAIDFDNHGNGVHVNLSLEKEFVVDDRRA